MPNDKAAQVAHLKVVKEAALSIVGPAEMLIRAFEESYEGDPHDLVKAGKDLRTHTESLIVAVRAFGLAI